MPDSDTLVSAADPPLHDQVDENSSILFEAPGISTHRTEGCLDLLTAETPSAAEAMRVTVTQSPDDWLDTWRARVGAIPARTWFVTTEDYARSATTGGNSTITTPDGSLRVDTVPSAGNLTGLGVAISEQLNAHRRSESDRPLVVCVDALDTLIQFTDTRTVFRFLHALTSQIENAGGVAHYHLDPAAHDDQTTNIFRTLFDTTISCTTEGEWSVRTR